MYEILITENGKAQLADSVLTGNTVMFSSFKISSQADDTSLNHVAYSALINNVETSHDEIWINCIVPESAGGFWLKYISILDDKNNIIAQGNIPEFYKAEDNLSPTVSDYTIKIKYDNADQVTINFNTQACSTVDNYYQLAESLIRLMNDHTSLAIDYAQTKTDTQEVDVDLEPIETRLDDLEKWRNNLVAFDIKGEGRYKYRFDLQHLPYDMMYPVIFQSGSNRNGSPLLIDIYRAYYWQSESDLDGDKVKGEPHVAGVDIRSYFLDEDWSGNANGSIIKLNVQKYRQTVANLSNMIDVKQKKYDEQGNDTAYNTEGMVNCPAFSGFYLRGRLVYEVITNSPLVKFSLYEKETAFSHNADASYNYQWSAVPLSVSDARINFGNTSLINL
ncbi:phage tail protein [Thiotrichales bacterium 19X7-9]|nr:phage tail protein [Thiotrichales bacterium 19X7-9]